MREKYEKYSRKHGDMFLSSYAPGDGSIDFNWMSQKDPNGAVLSEIVTESDVSEWLNMKGNSESFENWDILEMGSGVSVNVRLAHIVIRPFHTSAKLMMDGQLYEYKYHGPEQDKHGLKYYTTGNTDFYYEEDGRCCKVKNTSILMGLIFFLNHEKDFERNKIGGRESRRCA